MTPRPPAELAAVLAAEPTRQQTFFWSRSAWNNRMHDLPDVLQLLQDLPAEVDREVTREFVLRALQRDRVIPAFVAAMVWGHGTTGYGPTRVRSALTGQWGVASYQAPVRDAEVSSKLRGAVDVVRNEGAAEAYGYMYGAGRVKYLGGAFFTKWLYFVSAVDGVHGRDAAPILDTQVATWLRANGVMNLNPAKTKSYRDYLALLEVWGDRFGRTRVEIEQAIFGLARG
ncbi:hypothetical protein E1212_07180 [Jiangella ureilytica]|uniref:Uncharacterized protein n=1 Tax=Jiangella ureilytica TaxID=2530374 RepID=A0A4R4RUC2_9ACTN|nr:hypothetical protein [Jiangella ureilytica]TDC52919.1 hypothetical protein E1212_07180 [Jiangella ureilytica]